MFNRTEKYIVYLDIETLKYMYFDYTGARSYPVMKKMYTTLRDGYVKNRVVTPLSIDTIMHFINENRIDKQFLNMMNGIGQIQFLQRFTIKTLQLIRIINSFYDNAYKRPVWRDAYSGNPDVKCTPEYNMYNSLSAKNSTLAFERDKKNSQIFEFIDGYKSEKLVKTLAKGYYFSLWEQSSDLISPYFPRVGSPDSYIKEFLECDEIIDIPQFHILSNVLYPLLDTYGIKEVEAGLRDDELLAAETISVYLPYCNFYVTNVDIAELALMKGFCDLYNVKIYDNNEKSLYKFINDITEMSKTKEKFEGSNGKSRTIFRKGFSKG